MDTPPEERFDRVVRLARKLFDVPMVGVNLVAEDRQWTKAEVGFSSRELSLEESFCRHTLVRSEAMVVPDARLDERFADNRLVTDEPGVRFYAGQPLRAPNGQRVGALCLLDHTPRELSPDELDLLRDLGSWVEKELAIDEELLRAQRVSRQLLPRRAPDAPGYDVAGLALPARELGGDFYDWYEARGGLQLVLADVMGKGLPAAIIGAGVRAVLRGASRFNLLPEAVIRAAASLEEDLEETGSFVTGFVARLDRGTGTVDYVDVGHGLGMVLQPDGGVRRLRAGGLPMGTLPGDVWESGRTVLAPGEALVMASDGLLDYFDTPADALRATQEANASAADSTELLDVLASLVRGSAPADDVTAVVVRREARP
nr:SpoIIE family protein phosphatase [Auraticoccus cholistanensis]